MIVTREMAQKYLISRRCYLIGTAPNGDFSLVVTSVHWKEGMEVFEDYDECLAEIDRRRKQKIDSGYCPRCNYKHMEETDKDISYLDLVADVKGAKLYECKSCKAVWYKHPSYSNATGYDAMLKDFLIEWGSRDLKPNAVMKTVLHEVGNISVEKEYELYAVDVLFKNRSDFEPALIRLGNEPPSQEQFNKKGWHYLDTVKEMRPSPFAYPSGIGKLIMKTMIKGTRLMHVKSIQTKKVYAFEAHAGVFMPRELKGQDFELVNNGNEQEGALHYYMPADRGGPDIWTMTETTAVQIWGDRI